MRSMRTADNPGSCDRAGTGAGSLRLLAAFFVFVLVAAFNFGKPPSSDEHWFVIAADNYASSGALAPGTLIHPPLYTLVNGSLLKIFKTPAALKLWGGALGLGSMALMFFLGRACGAGRERAGLAALLMGTAPVFIQGSLLLDTDNTLVVFSLLAMLLGLVKERWYFFCGAFLLCLWVKLTACLPILVVFLAWAAADLFRGGKTGAKLLLSLAAGLALFLASFGIFCLAADLPFSMPFVYMYGTIFSKRIPGGGSVLLQGLQFALWVGLPFCMLWIAAAVRAARAGERNLDLLAVFFSAAIGAGYFFVGGTPFGFPKFQMPAFVLGCWLVSGLALEALRDFGSERRLFAGLLIGGAAFITAAGDPIYTLRYLLRVEMAAGRGTAWHMAVLSAQAAAPVLLAGFFWFLTRKTIVQAGRRAAAALLLACFSQFIAMNLMQSVPRNTLYTYGADGMEEAVSLAASALAEGGKAALPREIVGYLRLKGFAVEITHDRFWSDQAAINSAVSDPDCKVIIYGAPFNTLEQMKILTGERTAAALAAAGWRNSPAGSYQVWTRTARKK